MHGARRRTARLLTLAGALSATVLVLLSSYGGIPGRLATGQVGVDTGRTPVVRPDPTASYSWAALRGAPRSPLPSGSAAEPAADAVLVAAAPGSEVTVLLSLGFRNGSALSTLLQALADPSSAQYHRYLTAPAFSTRFAPNRTAYNGLLGYLVSAGATQIVSYPDRLAVTFSETPAVLGTTFHAPVGRFASNGSTYWAFAAAPSLPAPLAALVGSVVGLGPAAGSAAVPFATVLPPVVAAASPLVRSGAGTTYPAPVTINGTQYLYASDLQVGYDEEGLLDQYGPAVPSTAAALLWSGTYSGSSTLSVCSTTITRGRPSVRTIPRTSPTTSRPRGQAGSRPRRSSPSRSADLLRAARRRTTAPGSSGGTRPSSKR